MSGDRPAAATGLAARADELLADARRAREAGAWGDLRALVSAVLALDPANAEAEALLAGWADRRQMTLMFCDLVGSTAMADDRDPEEMGAILRRYRVTCTDVLERFGGFVEDHQGDGMLVRFGYPEVHEDDARRAVLAGLEVVAAVGACAEELRATHGVELHVRLAVHTDLVLLDNGAVTGPAPNEASRLQGFAPPDAVVVSDLTEALVRDAFELEPIGVVALRGVSRPMAAFVVRGERAAGDAAGSEAPGPFVGRRAEREQIAALWQAAVADRRDARPDRRTPARAVLVTGGPGIGKSRLVREAARAAGARCAECRCSSFHETTSLFPFRRLLERAAGIEDGDEGERRLAKLRARVGDGPDLPFLTAAVGVPAAAIDAPPDVDPGKLRTLALAAAGRLVGEHAAEGPCVLFVDDLHWADQSSLDLVSVLLTAPRPGLALVLTARDGFECPWPAPLVQRLPLAPLGAAELERLAGEMPEGAGLAAERRRELVARSDGVPLFLEELVRTADAVEHGRALHRSIHQADYVIPPVLRDPLLARLAAPGVDLGLVQLAATIGRDVDGALLRRLCDLPGDELAGRIRGLLAGGLVEAAPDGGVRFRHELLREAAYETQRRSLRRERHSRIADVLLEGGAAAAHGDAGGAAFHLERAHRHEEAVDAHLAAARVAQALGAHTEATTRLTQALGLLVHLPPGAPREQTELAIRQLRSFSAVMAGGYAAPAAAEDHPRCVELCEALGLGPELVPSLIRSWSYYAFRGRLDEADHVTVTMERGLPSGLTSFPLAFIGRGLVDFFRGRFGEARALMEAFVEHPWGRTEERPRTTWQLPNDPLASVTAHLVPTLWIAGEREAAAVMERRALERAQRLGFPYGPFSAGYVHSLLAMTRRLAGDHEGAARHARAMCALGERHGFVPWSLAGAIQGGLSDLHAGELGALDGLLSSVAAWRHVLVAEVWTPYWLTELAAAQRAVGRPGEALDAVDEALAVAAATGSDFFTAEALRLRGELRAQRGEAGAVEDLAAAVAKARAQEAPAFELRAAVALARAASGSPQAHDALATAIGRFARDAHDDELDQARTLVAR